MSNAPLTLFLDFDGVLHPLYLHDPPSGGESLRTQMYRPLKVYPGPYFIHAAQLLETLRPYLPMLDIVISSSWGHTHDLATLKAFLPPELADLVSDAVYLHPDLPIRLRLGWIGSGYERRRYIEAYIEEIRPGCRRWLAIDDQGYAIKEVHGPHHVVGPDSFDGLGAADHEALRRNLEFWLGHAPVKIRYRFLDQEDNGFQRPWFRYEATHANRILWSFREPEKLMAAIDHVSLLHDRLDLSALREDPRVPAITLKQFEAWQSAGGFSS